MKPKVYIVSDATGETALKVVQAALKQFSGALVTFETCPEVRDEQAIEDIVEQAAAERGCLIVHTLIDPAQRALLQRLCADAELTEVDLIGTLVARLGVYLHLDQQVRPGGLYEVDEAYFRRIAAVEFAVKNDDGQHPRNLSEADIVLVGISRTSKTPLSTYLAQRGHKVANVPLVLGIQPPPELAALDQEKIYALSIEADALFRIRQARLETLGMPADTAYGMRAHIHKEIEYARHVFEAHPRWPVLDVTDRAIEETAAELLALRKHRAARRD